LAPAAAASCAKALELRKAGLFVLVKSFDTDA
jgi:hypothetical protein